MSFLPFFPPSCLSFFESCSLMHCVISSMFISCALSDLPSSLVSFNSFFLSLYPNSHPSLLPFCPLSFLFLPLVFHFMGPTSIFLCPSFFVSILSIYHCLVYPGSLFNVCLLP
ncbi:hypothetical protein AMECASPLE_016933 [Ameca splendens]|uniref:Uncharacterized protein n=1 Tax=Ameca splendens TaxID=208324 RepID=A0ABV0YPY4_9TELE